MHVLYTNPVNRWSFQFNDRDPIAVACSVISHDLIRLCTAISHIRIINMRCVFTPPPSLNYLLRSCGVSVVSIVIIVRIVIIVIIVIVVRIQIIVNSSNSKNSPDPGPESLMVSKKMWVPEDSRKAPERKSRSKTSVQIRPPARFSPVLISLAMYLKASQKDPGRIPEAFRKRTAQG